MSERTQQSIAAGIKKMESYLASGGDASADNQLIQISKIVSIETELEDQGTELTDQGVTLDSIKTAIETFDTQNGTDLGNILAKLQAVETAIQTFDVQNGTDLALLLTELQQIEAELAGGIDVSIAASTVTPNLERATGAGTIASGSKSFSIANVGAADADILGGTNNLKKGEVVNFDAGLSNTYGAVAYDATGTELLITYNS